MTTRRDELIKMATMLRTNSIRDRVMIVKCNFCESVFECDKGILNKEVQCPECGKLVLVTKKAFLAGIIRVNTVTIRALKFFWIAVGLAILFIALIACLLYSQSTAEMIKINQNRLQHEREVARQREQEQLRQRKEEMMRALENEARRKAQLADAIKERTKFVKNAVESFDSKLQYLNDAISRGHSFKYDRLTSRASTILIFANEARELAALIDKHDLKKLYGQGDEAFDRRFSLLKEFSDEITEIGSLAHNIADQQNPSSKTKYEFSNKVDELNALRRKVVEAFQQ